MSFLAKQDKSVFESIQKEFHRQNTSIELIASENFVSGNSNGSTRFGHDEQIC